MAARRLLFASVVLVIGTLVSATPAGARDRSLPAIDANGDHVSALAVARPDGGTGDFTWFFEDGAPVVFGNNNESDRLVPGDYDGDGKTDAAVYRPHSGAGEWIIAMSSGGFVEIPFGDADQNDQPVPADYDGDGKTDIAVFREGSPASTWFVMKSSGGFITQQFGDAAQFEAAVPADYDCDGKADIAVRRLGPSPTETTPSTFIVMSSRTGAVASKTFGEAGDFYIPGDYDGDGCADLVVARRESTHLHWFGLGSRSGFFDFLWGDNGDDVIRGDFNGDGRDDVAIARRDPDHWILFAHDSATGGLISSPEFGDVATDRLLNEFGVQEFV
jgi:hypothetical protein